jgi:DNA-directed RNA polymerase delta subunit
MNNNEVQKLVSSYKDLFYQATEVLVERSRDIVRARFGIDSNDIQTLDGIGQAYGLTRERIRQIIDHSVGQVRKSLSNELSEEIYNPLESVLRSRGGIVSEDVLIAKYSGGDDTEAGAIRFFLEVASNINRLKRKDVGRTVVHVEFDEAQWEQVKDVVHAILSDKREPLAHEVLHEQYAKHADADESVDDKLLVNYLEPVKAIAQNPFGRWGLSHWRDVRPRGVREKIYLVLKENGKPMHFAQIAADIDKHNLSKRPGTKTNIQTVHNELIKDVRFILVGRGLYALKGWGYAAGTVREVIAQIMRDSSKASMTTKEIIEAVKKVREVRDMTIVVNLNSFFKKVGRGVYMLAENK